MKQFAHPAVSTTLAGLPGFRIRSREGAHGRIMGGHDELFDRLEALEVDNLCQQASGRQFSIPLQRDQLGAMIGLMSVFLLTSKGGPLLAPSFSLNEFLGYMGLFSSVTVMMRVVVAVLWSG